MRQSFIAGISIIYHKIRVRYFSGANYKGEKRAKYCRINSRFRLIKSRLKYMIFRILQLKSHWSGSFCPIIIIPDNTITAN